ncbi:Scramblase [Baffinella frigidus]|nr:Scramblase [Cryptophyta sp. CCMP2293]
MPSTETSALLANHALPNQLQMGGGAGYETLSAHPNLFVKQTRRGWFQELLGCEAKTEFKIATMQEKKGDVMYALEESSLFLRLLCPMSHSWSMTVWQGDGPEGPAVAKYQRPLRTPLAPLKCCCHQEVQHQDANGVAIGETVEEFFCFVPKFKITNAQGNVEYMLSQPTCWNGMFVDCWAEGVCNMRVPFYVYPEGSKHVTGQQVGKIVKVWAGLGTEMFTDADKFELVFPEGANPESKARLLGSLFLLNQLLFEDESKESKDE